MPSDKDQKDIEIIPPDASPVGNSRTERIYISFGDSASFASLPLHKRILLGAAWLGGAIIFLAIVFLIVASAVLIWIPLLLAIGLITTAYFYFRARFARRK